MTKQFNEYRFDGLNYHVVSNKYWSMNRVSEDEQKIVVKVADAHLFKTRYGYGLILDDKHVVWLRDWAVDRNWFGNEVMLDAKYFSVKEWGDFSEDFDENEEALDFNHWVAVAKEQRDADNMVKWQR